MINSCINTNKDKTWNTRERYFCVKLSINNHIVVHKNHTNVSGVPRSLQGWVSTIYTVVLKADVFQLFVKYEHHILQKNWKTSAVSTTDWMVETQQSASYVVHQTRSLDEFILYFIYNIIVFVNKIYDMVNTQFHKFYARSFARVLYLILMTDIGRWLPWMLPGSTGRFSITILRSEDTIAVAKTSDSW